MKKGFWRRFILALVLALSIFLPNVLPIDRAWAEESLLRIIFVDVGQADSTIIICDGEVLMIDGGNAADSQLIFSMLRNTLGIDHINYMIATPPHEDHVGGLAAAFNACSVDVLLTPVLEYDTKAFQSMMKYAEQQGTSIQIPQPGDSFMIGSAYVEILGPVRYYENYNDMSIICKITYGETTFLFGGDAEWDAEHDLVDSGADLSADVLRVNHHGSNSSSTYVFLRAVMPTYAIISVGTGNPYGHPTEETLARLGDVGAVVMRTDEMGSIECTSDGSNIIFNPLKKPKK